MRKKLFAIILILCLLTGTAAHVLAADHPIRMTAEPDPDCTLTGPGTLGYVRFVIRNTGSSAYTLYEPKLSGKVLEEPYAVCPEEGETDRVTVAAGSAQEFTLYDVYLPANALNTDVRFTLSWLEAVEYEEAYIPEEDPDDMPEPDEEGWEDYEEDTEPETEVRTAVSYEQREISTTIFIETAEDPVMSLSVKANSSLVRTDDEVTVKYVLSNPTKFDFEDITLRDTAAGGEIDLEDTTLRAGDSVTVLHTFTMGRENVVLSPEAIYTVRGKTVKTKAARTVTVKFMFDSLTLDVQPYSATAEGTMFGLTVTNAGTHRMRDIRLTDETGTKLCEEFSLDPGQSRSITYTYGSYTGLSENRRVSFLIHATDAEGEEYSYQKPGSFEIRPYVGSGQVSLLMNVTLSDYFEEKNTVRMLFEIRNYSDVAISNAIITESEVLGGSVQSYPSLTKGVTTFTKEFSLGEGISVLTFHMEADDAGGTHYATEPVSLHVDQLALAVKNGTFGAAGNTVIDTTGTVFDTDQYASYISTGIAAVGLAALVFLLISLMFRGAEKYIRKTMPAPAPAAKITLTGESAQDTARMRFGYMKPAKLRYLEDTAAGKRDTLNGQSTTGSVKKTAPSESRLTGTVAGTAARVQPAPVKLVSTGTYKKPGRQMKMLSTADTLVFHAPEGGKKPAPAREEKTSPIPRPVKQPEVKTPEVKKTETETARVRVIPARPEREAASAISDTVLVKRSAERPAPEEKKDEKKKTPEKRLTMTECLRAGKPYTFEIDPPAAVLPKKTEPEIVFIGS